MFLMAPSTFSVTSDSTSSAPAPGTGVTVVGPVVLIEWDSVVAGMLQNIAPRARNPILYLPVQETVPTDSVSDMGIELVTANVLTTAHGPVGYNGFIYDWHKTGTYDQRLNDSVAQAVDWVYKPGAIEHRGMMTLLRDVRVMIETHGRGLAVLETAWPWRVLNATFGTDFKTWVAQIIDHTAGAHPEVQLVLDKSGLRARVYDSTGMQERTWDNTTLHWGDVTDLTVGNVLVGDVPAHEVHFAEAIMGGWVTLALHGNILNNAEWIRIESVEVHHIGLGRRIRLGSPDEGSQASSLYTQFVF
jgi:hypothetical protein